MFGLIKATRPPHKTKERMTQMCVPCCQKHSSVTTIVMNVLLPTLVGNKLFVKQYISNTR